MTDQTPSDGPRRVAGAAGATQRAAAPIAHIAMAELTRRRARCVAAVRRNPDERRAALAHLRLWAAIALWSGARPPADLFDGEVHGWWDLDPARGHPTAWLATLAAEARAAAQAALFRAEAQPGEETQTRARHLLALDHHLSLAAGLGPMDLTPPMKDAA